MENNEFYHVFNRSVGNEIIFSSKKFKQQLLNLIEFYRFPQQLRYSYYFRLPLDQKKMYYNSYLKEAPLVSIYAYSIMPNHYHLILKQESENGIAKYVSNFQNSFAKYLNTIQKRHGGIFQNPFKAKLVETDSEMLHLSRYIHLNPVTAYLIKPDELAIYPWTSFPEYLHSSKTGFINAKMILNLSGSSKKYQVFVENQVDFQRKLKKVRKLILD